MPREQQKLLMSRDARTRLRLIAERRGTELSVVVEELILAAPIPEEQEQDTDD